MHAPVRSPIARVFAIGNALIASALAVAVIALEARSVWLQAGAGFAAVLLLLSSFGLLKRTRWRLFALRACAWLGVAVAVGVLGAVGVWAGHAQAARAGLPPGSPLATMLALALLLPYLLLYPALQLIWAHRQERAPRGAELLLPEEA